MQPQQLRGEIPPEILERPCPDVPDVIQQQRPGGGPLAVVQLYAGGVVQIRHPPGQYADELHVPVRIRPSDVQVVPGVR